MNFIIVNITSSEFDNFFMEKYEENNSIIINNKVVNKEKNLYDGLVLFSFMGYFGNLLVYNKIRIMKFFNKKR